MRPLDPALVDLALAQGGVFASRQGRTLGVTPPDLQSWVGAGELVRVRQGAYALTSALAGLTPERRLAVVTKAVLLTRRERTWASHHAALALSGLPLHSVDLERVDLCAEVPRSFRRSGAVTHPLPPRDRCVLVSGYRSVSAALALAQTTAASGLKAGLVPADRALRDGLVGLDEIAIAAERAALGVRGRGVVDRLVQLVDPSSESPGETLTRLILVSTGTAFRTQVAIRSGAGLVGRVDFLVDDRIVIEFDGLVKYAGIDGRAALAAEKARETRLVELGYEVVRLVWADLADPAVVTRKIRAARARLQTRGLARG